MCAVTTADQLDYIYIYCMVLILAGGDMNWCARKVHSLFFDLFKAFNQIRESYKSDF